MLTKDDQNVISNQELRLKKRTGKNYSGIQKRKIELGRTFAKEGKQVSRQRGTGLESSRGGEA
jgi:hypothetical protein